MNAPLALIDVMDGDQVRQSLTVLPGEDGTARVRIGRALHCELTLDDAHLAGEHAELLIHAEPRGSLTLLPSLNGAWQGHHHHRAGAQLEWPADGVLTLGQTRLRLRHAAQPLEAELAPLQSSRRGLPIWATVLWMTAALAGLNGLDYWLAANPEQPWLDILRPLIGMGVAVLVWSGLWALLSQLFQRRFPFLTMLKRTLAVFLGLVLFDQALAFLAFAFSLPSLMVPATLAPPIGLALLVFWQARVVLPRKRRLVGALVVGALGLWLLFSWSAQEQRQHRWRAPYMATLLPPQFRAAPLRPVDDLLKDAAAMRADLAAKSKLDSQGNPTDDED